MEEREGKMQLILKHAEDTETLKEKYASLVGNLFLQIDEEKHESEVLEHLQKVLRKHHGPSPVYVHYIHAKKTIKLQPSFL